MSELIKVRIKRVVGKPVLRMTIKDVHPDAHNVKILLDEREKYQSGPNLSAFVLALLYDYTREKTDSEFIKEYVKTWYKTKYGNLEAFDEKQALNSMPSMPSCTRASELVEEFIKNTEIVELNDSDFWDHYDGGDLIEERLPTAVIQISLKNARYAALFDNVEWETAFDITQ